MGFNEIHQIIHLGIFVERNEISVPLLHHIAVDLDQLDTRLRQPPAHDLSAPKNLLKRISYFDQGSVRVTIIALYDQLDN